MKSFLGKAAVAFVLATALCGQAIAQPNLVSSAPEANAVVTDKLQQIALTFSEGIAIELSKITVRGPKGLLKTTLVAYRDKTVVLVAFLDTLALGKYTVDWRVVSAGKRKSHGVYAFSVKRPAPVPLASREPFEKPERAEKAVAGVVDLNTASADDLAALPGIQATGAAAIIAARPYGSVDQLVSKGIVPRITFDTIKNRIVVAGASAKSGGDEKKAPAATGPVDVNTATVEELDALGIGPTRAAAIVAGRPYESVDQLVSKGIVAQASFDAIKNRIVVAGAAAKSGGDEKKAPAATGPVDVNTATVEELEALEGVGPTRAAAIVAGRPYESVDELVSKGIVAQATFDAIKNRIVAAGVAVKSGGDEKKAPAATGPVDVNTATVEELDALEGIGPTRAAEIVAGRPYTSIDDLVAKGVVPQATFERIKGSLVVGAPAAKPVGK